MMVTKSAAGGGRRPPQRKANGCWLIVTVVVSGSMIMYCLLRARSLDTQPLLDLSNLVLLTLGDSKKLFASLMVGGRAQ